MGQPSTITSTGVEKSTADQYFDTSHIKADLKRKTLQGGALTIAHQFGKEGLTTAASIIMSRLLGPENSGLIAMVMVFSGFILMFNDLGLSSATIQRKEINQAQVSLLFWINIATGIVLGLVMAAFAPVVAWFYDEPALLLVTIVLSCNFLVSGLSIQHRALLRRQMRFTPLIVIDIVSTVLGIAAGLTAAVMLPEDQRYWAIVIKQLVPVPMEIIAVWTVCRWRPSKPAKAEGVRSMLSFGGNLTGFRLVNYLARNIDNLLIGKFFGAVQLGLYNRAYGLLLLPLQRVNNPISSVAISALSRVNDDPQRYRKAYTDLLAKVCLITMPMVAFMMGAADWFVVLLLGPEWASAATLFTLLGISGLTDTAANTTGWLFSSQGRAKEQFRWGFISTFLTISAILIGLPWGASGVALSYGLSGLLIRSPLLFWYVGRTGVIRTRDIYLTVAPFFTAALAVLGTLLLLRESGVITSPLVGVLAAMGITAAVTLGVLMLIPSGRAQIMDIRSLPALLKRK